MEGFMNPNVAFKHIFNQNTKQWESYPVNPEDENKRMEQCGFTIDRDNAIYIKEHFGAFKSNVNPKIKSIEDLRNYYDEVLKRNPYDEVIRLMDEGYEFVLGPGAPAENGDILGVGLYCKNYPEILERSNIKKTR